MKTLLVPIDFSETSKKALQVAATIAKRIKAKIVITHMAGLEDGFTKTPNSFEEALYFSKVVGKKFEELVQAPYLDGILVEPILQKHLNFNSVSKMALEMNTDLIIMGSNGAKGFEEFFIGSNTEKVVRSSEIPVLVIKDNSLNFDPERILYASDFNLEGISAYHRIVKVATLLGAQIEFLYINTPGNNFKSTAEMDQTLVDFFKKVEHPEPLEALKTVKRFADYTVEQGIMRYASLSGTDIIAIPTHGHKGITHFFKGSISEDIANHATMPVLTVKM